MGNVEFGMSVLTVGNQQVIDTSARGQMTFPCSVCGEPMTSSYEFPFQLILNWEDTPGEVRWDEETCNGFNDYHGRIGNDADAMDIAPILREQVILNCDPVMAVNQLETTVCPVCGQVETMPSSAPDAEDGPFAQQLRKIRELHQEPGDE